MLFTVVEIQQLSWNITNKHGKALHRKVWRTAVLKKWIWNLLTTIYTIMVLHLVSSLKWYLSNYHIYTMRVIYWHTTMQGNIICSKFELVRNQIKQCDVCQIRFERKKYSTLFKVITCPFKMRELQFLKAVG